MCLAKPVRFALCGTGKWEYDYCHQATWLGQTRAYCADTKFEPSPQIQKRDTPCDKPRCTTCLPRPVMEPWTQARGPDSQVPTLFLRDLAAGRVQCSQARPTNRSTAAIAQKRKAAEPIMREEPTWKLPLLKLDTPARMYLPFAQVQPSEKQETARQEPRANNNDDNNNNNNNTRDLQRPATAEAQAVEAEAQSLDRIRVAGRWSHYCQWRARTQVLGLMAYWNDECRLSDSTGETTERLATKNKHEGVEGGDNAVVVPPELIARKGGGRAVAGDDDVRTRRRMSF